MISTFVLVKSFSANYLFICSPLFSPTNFCTDVKVCLSIFYCSYLDSMISEIRYFFARSLLSILSYLWILILMNDRVYTMGKIFFIPALNNENNINNCPDSVKIFRNETDQSDLSVSALTK